PCTYFCFVFRPSSAHRGDSRRDAGPGPTQGGRRSGRLSSHPPHGCATAQPTYRRRPMKLGLVVGLLLSAPLAQAKTRTYALVIAQNRSLDKGVRPLQFADDDGVKN